jgi:hypothetical protein|eukprot:COSAG06_NODE_17652_length_928_cov_1.123040_2_plen_121_part_00
MRRIDERRDRVVKKHDLRPFTLDEFVNQSWDLVLKTPFLSLFIQKLVRQAGSGQTQGKLRENTFAAGGHALRVATCREIGDPESGPLPYRSRSARHWADVDDQAAAGKKTGGCVHFLRYK